MQFLVADDDADAAEMYRVALEERGHIVTISRDGQECLNLYRDAIRMLKQSGKDASRHEPFDAVILDYKMPLIDGLEVARKILKMNASQRIIFASSYVKETLMESVKELDQVIELVQKPFEPDILVDLVEDTSMFSRLSDLNSMAMDVMKNGTLDNSQIDMLLQSLKKIQKAGTI